MIILGLEKPPPETIDLEGILPESLNGLSETDVKKLKVQVGNRREEIGAVFFVSYLHWPQGEPELWLRGDFRNVKRVGAKMTSGHIQVHGDVGTHVGAAMSGGVLQIFGNAGDWVGAEMNGGTIAIVGHAGNNIGTAYIGSRRGMAGGSIGIHGNAGDEVGVRMRRGRIWIKGSCGQDCGACMIAGTIIVLGRLGERAGAGMKRGTIYAMNEMSKISPGFVHSYDGEPAYLTMLLNRFYKSGWPEDRMPLDEFRKVRCYRGDLLTGGRGEIWHVIR